MSDQSGDQGHSAAFFGYEELRGANLAVHEVADSAVRTLSPHKKNGPERPVFLPRECTQLSGRFLSSRGCRFLRCRARSTVRPDSPLHPCAQLRELLQM